MFKSMVRFAAAKSANGLRAFPMIQAFSPSVAAARSFHTSSFKFQVQDSTASSTTTKPTKITDLAPLKFEQDLYATIKIHGKSYLVTEGDTVILPFRLKEAEVGDVLNFHNVTTIGSRNYTVVGEPIDKSLFSIKAYVVEKTKNPMYVKEVTKRRNRHVRHIPVKHDKTILRISELKV